MVKILSLSFCVRNFLPGENTVWSTVRGNAAGHLRPGARPASHCIASHRITWGFPVGERRRCSPVSPGVPAGQGRALPGS